jgi:hypothetical protein
VFSIISFIYGAVVMAAVFITLLGVLTPRIAQPTTHVRMNMSVRAQTLANWGRIRTYRVGHNLRARVVEYPVLDPIAEVKLWFAAKIVDRIANALQVESATSFALWWRTTETNTRKRMHHGRHRAVELHDREWRKRWAAFPTSDWPTLVTPPNGTAVLTANDILDGRPIICERELKNYADPIGGSGRQRQDDDGATPSEVHVGEVPDAPHDADSPRTADLASA